MTAYPGAIYAPRTKANKVGIVYDAAKTTVGFAEDVTKLDDEVVAVETCLGLSPKGTSASVAEKIKGIRSLSDATEDTIVIKTGKVGIGTTTPTTLLHITTSDATTYLPNAGGAARLRIENSNTTDNNFSGLTFASDDTNGTLVTSASILGITTNHTAGSATGELQFVTRNVTPTEAMRIDKNGNVGIATSVPTAFLDVNSDILRLRTAKTPATAGASGNAGDICWDASNIYVCVATNTWKKIGIATW